MIFIGMETSGAISAAIRKPDQIIQPFQFGDDASNHQPMGQPIITNRRL